MKKAKAGSSWFFVDESGDPNFYDHRGRFVVGKPGCSEVLILGFIETQYPEPLRRAVLELQAEIVNDPYFARFPSIKRTQIAFHAKDDLPEIRTRFFELISSLDFKARFAVARKTEQIFRDTFQARPNAFYDHLVSYSFEKVLHRYQENHIYIAARGATNRQAPLSDAIARSRAWFLKNCGGTITTVVEMQVQQPNREPCLSIIDYMNWAVYRAYTRREMQYYKLVEDKVSLLVDLYDHPRKWYNRKNPFDIEKAMPL